MFCTILYLYLMSVESKVDESFSLKVVSIILLVVEKEETKVVFNLILEETKVSTRPLLQEPLINQTSSLIILSQGSIQFINLSI